MRNSAGNQRSSVLNKPQRSIAWACYLIESAPSRPIAMRDRRWGEGWSQIDDYELLTAAHNSATARCGVANSVNQAAPSMDGAGDDEIGL